jgi:ATP-dependent RNA helicase DeaD
MTSTFQDLGLIPELLQTLTELDYAAPTPIQAEAIPHLLAGSDVMGQAQTGTGKTAAFTLPMLQNLEPEGLQTLILAPTRELAVQTADAVFRYGNKLGVRVLPIYGGQPYDRQKRRLKKGVHVVVGTPGRTLDLIRQKAMDLSNVRYVVLDEADEMLKMGFIEDVEEILSATNAETRQTTLFSATLPDQIRRLGRTYMHDPVLIAIKSQEMTVENIGQRYYMVRESDKVAALCRLLEVEELKNTLVFTRTKVGAAELAETLIARDYPAEAIHGDLQQTDRERILRRFRTGQLTILVATDVVARGVDIPDVSHVINFNIPQLPIEYVHRVGRTGRAGRGGDAITLITPRQGRHLKMIEEYTRKRISKGTLPTREDVLRRRDEQFRAQLIGHIENFRSETEYTLLDEMMEIGYPPELVAAAAIKLLRAHEEQRPIEKVRVAHEQAERHQPRKSRGYTRDKSGNEPGMVRLHMNIGRSIGLRPADIVYSIASRANIPGRSIGAIDIRKYETFLDVPQDQVNDVLQAMKHGKIRGKSMNLDFSQKH